MNNAMQIGMHLYAEIEAVRNSGNWKWEKRIAGPLSGVDVSTISNFAGCWCDVPSAGVGESVRFYANQNHPMHGGRP